MTIIQTLASYTILLALFIQIPSAGAQTGGDAFTTNVVTTKERILAMQRKHLCLVLIDQAQEQLRNKFPGRAEACLTEAVKIAEELKQPDVLLLALHQQALFYRGLNMPDHARSVYAKAHRTFIWKRKFRPWERQSSDEAALFREYSELLSSQNSRKLAEKMQAISNDLQEQFDRHKTRIETDRNEKSVDIDFGPYMARLQMAIERNWIPLQSDINAGRVVGRFVVNADGSIDKNRIITASPSWTANQACLRAVEAAGPLDPLPNGAPETVEIQVTFETFGPK